MKKLRRIVVAGRPYLWRYRYDDYDYSLPSYLLILPEEGKKTEIRIYFPLIDKPHENFMLNTGFRAVKDGKTVLINLNEPRYIAEIISFLMDNKVNFANQQCYLFRTGEQLLNEMGYIF